MPKYDLTTKLCEIESDIIMLKITPFQDLEKRIEALHDKVRLLRHDIYASIGGFTLVGKDD